MIPSLPLAAALLDQYALLTAALAKPQNQTPQQTPTRFDASTLISAAAIHQQQQAEQALALEALWPSLLYGRLLAANSSTSLSPQTPPNNKTRKTRGFSVQDLLDSGDNNNKVAGGGGGEESSSAVALNLSTPTSQTSPKTNANNATESSSVTVSTANSSSSLVTTVSPTGSKWLGNAHGPLEELCKLASRPLTDDNVGTSPSQFLVSHMMMPTSSHHSPLARAVGEFGSCPNFDQASSASLAALLQQQQHRLRQAAAAAAAAGASASSSSTAANAAHSSGSNHHHRFHHHHQHHHSSSNNKPSVSSASLGNVALHSMSLVRRKRKTRTSFTPHQIAELEKRFFKQKYLTSSDRDDLASGLNLTAGQVITWFQNRRAKLKRDIEEIKGDMKLVDGNLAGIGSLSSVTPPSPGGSYVDEDDEDGMDIAAEEDEEQLAQNYSKPLHAVSEPSIHHLVKSQMSKNL